MDSANEARVLKLLDIEEIKKLKYRYMRHMMLGDIDAMAELFTDNVKAEYTDGQYSFAGKKALVDFLRNSHAPDSGMRAIWNVGHPEIEFTGEDTATGIWFFRHLTIDQKAGTNLQQAAFYRDGYTKCDGHWLISHTGYQRVLEERWSRNDTPSLVVEVG